MAVVSQLIDYLTLEGLPTRFDGLLQSVVIAAVGGLLLAVGRTGFAATRARAIGLAAFLLMGAMLTFNSLLMARKVPEAYHYVPGTMSLVMMVAVGTLPLRPMEAFGLGLAIEIFYALTLRWARAASWVGGLNLDGMQFGVMLLATLLATVLAGVLYAQRRREHQAHEEAIRERSRALLSESGASIGRLAAALSHELNTPVGALVSSAESMVISSERMVSVGAGER
ncbi:MAG TPA: hypothetical protein DEH78_07785, partial [Solibacterales bacterium]|nr:hypothetical protein [Bryobacterales bacterium]